MTATIKPSSAPARRPAASSSSDSSSISPAPVATRRVRLALSCILSGPCRRRLASRSFRQADRSLWAFAETGRGEVLSLGHRVHDREVVQAVGGARYEVHQRRG